MPIVSRDDLPRPGEGFDLVTEAMTPAAPIQAGAVVRVEGAKPAEFKLSAPITIGSGSDCDIVVPDRTVSRSHVELTAVPGGVFVRDLGSTNGTFYLGQRIGTMTLSIGTCIQIGGVTVSLDPDEEQLLTRLEYHGDEYRGVLGRSSRMKKLFALLQRLEGSLATVLVEGESGVGKEVVANAIHQGSAVAKGRLVTINCGAIPRELVGSELFGHRKGAFTGALDHRRGAFENADGGTLFLDEIGELPLDVQPALLRALELGEVRPIGSDEPRNVRVRVIAATNRDLHEEVAAGRFRQDLFFRLAVVRIQVPPLRVRPEDVELLARHFARMAGIRDLPRAVLEELKGRNWTGNARELRNALQSYVAVGELPPATPQRALSVDDAVSMMFDPTQPYSEQKDALIERFNKGYLKELLAYANGNQAVAASVAQLDRTYLGRLLAKYGMNARRG